MQDNITILNFDGGCCKQSFFQNKNSDWLNLELIPNTNLLCEKDSLLQIAQKLRERKNSNITFLESGNYHYVSYLLLSEIKHPFTVVLFDHHTDTLQSPSDTLISCGSWVLESLQNLPMLKKVIIIGVSKNGRQYIPSSIAEKVTVYTKETLQKNFQEHLPLIIEAIPTDSVYISIDKDVLDRKEAITAWDHGVMKLQQLVEVVKEIVWKREFIGIDICGEYPVNPTNAYKRHTREALEKNNHVNRVILEHIRYWLGGGTLRPLMLKNK